MGYLKRTADAVLTQHLEAFGAILIEGPKWCGCKQRQRNGHITFQLHKTVYMRPRAETGGACAYRRLPDRNASGIDSQSRGTGS